MSAYAVVELAVKDVEAKMASRPVQKFLTTG